MLPEEPFQHNKTHTSINHQLLQIVLVDDDLMVRRTLAFAMRSMADDVAVMTLSHVEELKQCVLFQVDVAIINLDLPHNQVSDAIAFVREHYPITYIMGLQISGYEVVSAEPLMPLGVNAIIGQDTSLKTMWTMIQTGVETARTWQ